MQSSGDPDQTGFVDLRTASATAGGVHIDLVLAAIQVHIAFVEADLASSEGDLGGTASSLL
ncbi:hypothetical protein EJB05_02256, partial [Eragrostis curvula]